MASGERIIATTAPAAALTASINRHDASGRHRLASSPADPGSLWLTWVFARARAGFPPAGSLPTGRRRGSSRKSAMASRSCASWRTCVQGAAHGI